MSVGLVYDPIYLKHDTGMHPENASRLERTVAHLEETSVMGQLVPIPARAATTEEIARVHSPGYITYVESFAQRGGGALDPDTVVVPASYDAATHAAGGLMNALDAVMKGEVDSAFALVRPPGHHAVRWEAMGFCLFNNVAVAAQHAMACHGLERIMIIDFDVHHGNGTQDAFYDDPHVLYFSSHQSPFYPGSGGVDEVGDGAGAGATVNVPMPAWCGDEEYERVYQEVLAPVARRFGPQLILVSAGYDPHWADQISMMQLTTTGFARLAEIFKGLATELCDGRLAFVLEGGYHLDALAASVRACIDVLLGNPIVDPLGPPNMGRGGPSIDSLLQAVKETHKLA